MKNIFITATNTNIGKTYTTLKLIPALTDMGYKVGVFKPIETGVTSEALDATLLLKTCQKYNTSFQNLTTQDICPIQLKLPAAPIVSADFQPINIDLILQTADKLSTLCDILLIEGAGGLMVPINKDYYMIDLLSDLKAQPLLVTHDKLGCINDTLLNLHLLQTKGLQPITCINVQDQDAFEEITLPYYQKYFPQIYIIQKQLIEFANALINNNYNVKNR